MGIVYSLDCWMRSDNGIVQRHEWDETRFNLQLHDGLLNLETWQAWVGLQPQLSYIIAAMLPMQVPTRDGWGLVVRAGA